MNSAGSGSEHSALLINCFKTLAMTSLPDTNISIKALTISYFHQLLPCS
jgi:hypothetical protein